MWFLELLEMVPELLDVVLELLEVVAMVASMGMDQAEGTIACNMWSSWGWSYSSWRWFWSS